MNRYKTCRKCNKMLPLNSFHKDKTKKDGYCNECKTCRKERSKKWYKDNKEYKAEYHKNYYNDHKEELKQKEKIWRKTYNPCLFSFTCKCCNKKFETSQKDAVFCSQKCYRNYRRGENHPLYDHNKTDEERINDRSTDEYREWRNKVFERDNYTCQCCGQYGGDLNAHHLNGYNWDKDNRYNVDNGITLCKKCHKDFHDNYGKGNNTIEQFKEWINGGEESDESIQECKIQ